MNIEFYTILLPLAMILVLSKLLSIGAGKLGIPQVVGMLLAGILLGFIKFIPGQTIFTDSTLAGLQFVAEIGVILIMFSAGIETNVSLIKQTGFAASLITIAGVVFPLGLGFLISGLFNGFSMENLYSNLFYGVILTATSVGVTVAALKEMGKLQTKVGTAIVSAAIIDDIIGVIVLSVIISLGSSNGNSSSIGTVFLKTAGFFIFVAIIGILVHFLFKYLDKKYEHHRRLPIFGIAFAFFMAYCSEKFFGIADITGAFAAGILLSGGKNSEYIERRTDIASYIIFTPVFFAKIGLTTNFSSITPSIIGFGLCFILVGILGKLIGCGLGAKIAGFSFPDSIKCGLGMMCRAEVCLISAEKGITAGLIDSSIQPFILLLIIITSFFTPLFLKMCYKKEDMKAQDVLVN